MGVSDKSRGFASADSGWSINLLTGWWKLIIANYFVCAPSKKDGN
jgi:hypothetical protein